MIRVAWKSDGKLEGFVEKNAGQIPIMVKVSAGENRTAYNLLFLALENLQIVVFMYQKIRCRPKRCVESEKVQNVERENC